MKLDNIRSSRRRRRDESVRAKRGFFRQIVPVTALLALGLSASVVSLAQSFSSRDLIKTDLADLMSMEVTSVSKKEQKLSKVPAAIYVINQDDIRRSGANNIPDLLRMVPGVDVAQIDAHTWAISIRGFGGLYTNKVLVLIDGRSVYTPSFSGVYWDQQDVPLEDIERIEVIRGPGGTVWGANAMNGVINIITKSAKATQGGLLRAGTGSEETAQGLLQYGGKIRRKGAYRIFGNYFNVSNSTAADGTQAADGWHAVHGGFRSDWDLSPRDTMTVQGDLLRTTEGQPISELFSNALPLQLTFNDKFRASAGNVLGRWNRTLSNGSDMSLQVYYDRYVRDHEGASEGRNTFDLDFQHHLVVGSRHDIVWGLGYRVTGDHITPGYSGGFVPQRRTDNLFSSFIQDEMRVTNSLWFTLGSKLEHNGYTGFEFQPSAQLVWTPTDRQAIWASVARAIRQPARSDSDLQIDIAAFPLDPTTLAALQLQGNPQLKTAEELLSYQVGYRAQVSEPLSLDVATFWNSYHHLQTAEPADPFFTVTPTPPHMVFPLVLNDKAHGSTYGAEIFANWNVTGRWQISPGYTVIHMNVTPDPSSQDTTVAGTAGDTPKHKFEIRSLVSLPHNVSWDSALYHVGRFPDADVSAYNRVDTRLAWRVGESVQLSVVGQNLLTPRHTEFQDTEGLLHSQVGRSVYGKITWYF
jgi:iron complex outermembrane recepter protein